MAAMITTVDNPYDPRTEFDEWYSFDCARARRNNHLDSCSLVARMANTSPMLSDALNDQIIEDAIDDIIRLDPDKSYRKLAV